MFQEPTPAGFCQCGCGGTANPGRRFINHHHRTKAHGRYTKRCAVCGETKPLAQFSKDRNRKDGYNGQCRLCHRKSVKEASKRHRERRAATQRAWAKAHPEKIRAHSAAAYAVKTGRLTQPDACPRCGAEGQVQAHHEDYDKPLEVEWLCGPCHRETHGLEFRDAG